MAEKHRGVKRLLHPQAGELRVNFEVLVLPDEDDQRLITWIAADASLCTSTEHRSLWSVNPTEDG